MSPKSKKEYLDAIVVRYKSANKTVKSKILDEFCAIYSCHRKHAVRIINKHKRYTKKKHKQLGRPACYNNNKELITVLKNIWFAAYQPCGKRLHAILQDWLPYYHQTYGRISLKTTLLLGTISAATMDRLLTPIKISYNKRGRCTTKPGTLIKKRIPIKTNQWDETKPGFLEADTVAHCGTSTAGNYVNTLDVVDIATGWTEQRAVWGKGETQVQLQIQDIEQSLPFPLLGFDSDNGSEFLNYHLLRYFHQRKRPIQFTRSRPYYKNDNAHIEQKNWTHVRQWLGYERFDKYILVSLLNDLYQHEWRFFHNFFCPSVKIIEKNRIGSKTVKRYDRPKTPFQRTIQSPHVSKQNKELLTQTMKPLNPFHLRKTMDQKLRAIIKAI